jgi:hypothetical protein
MATGAQRANEPSEPLREGDLVELECIAHNSKPAANITWLSGSEVLAGDNGGAGGELDSATGRRSVQATRAQRQRRLLQRNHVQLNADGHTYNTHSFLSLKLSRHENGAQIGCRAQNGPMREPLVKSVELQVQRKCFNPDRAGNRRFPTTDSRRLSICPPSETSNRALPSSHKQTRPSCSWSQPAA